MSAKNLFRALLLATATTTLAGAASADTQRRMEKLDRGAIAVKGEGGVLVSWRLLAGDADSLKFDIWRDGKKVKTVTGVSSWLDPDGVPGSSYQIQIAGQKTALFKPWENGWLDIPLDLPAGGTTPDGQAYTYTANDASVGDLDGDGDYEIILKWDPTNSQDNSRGGYTGPVLLDAYTLEGKKLWRIDLGKNIRAGAHYTQFMVADYDGDGKAELVVKTADGSRDTTGKVIGNPNADWVSKDGELEQGDRTGSVQRDGKLMAQFQGRILSGPEYLSVFNGQGEVVDTIPYWPTRVPEGDTATPERQKEIWGDGYGNRSERYLAGVAWLDGHLPSAVMARGYYGRSTLVAYDYRNGKLTQRWTFDSAAPGVPEGFGGQGNHQLSVADVDMDGRDEIVYGSMALDDNGQPLWTAKLFHGDALHVGDLDPEHPGLERFGVHESPRANGGIGSAMLDAKTGAVLWTTPTDKDTGRGIAIDVDPRYPGSEAWASNSGQMYSAKGQVISETRPRQQNFAVWWDGDLLREILDGNTISKWDWTAQETKPLLVATGFTSNNGTKATPTLSGDILGDWREEVVLRAEDNRSLRIFSTAIPTSYGFVTLMQDGQYRAAIAWQNTAYNQPPHPSFHLGDGMKAPPKTRIKTGN
ncbi:rhamnogalacturonan lyase [Asticcacaulis biprosthecium]|uniref:rhamnogalacturonan lyase n=1 Tax=Asticcacaulis biprosthecium TaxID=76891 RepID=UPI00030D0038|nr:rhamnogalacturonan lyase [Asticcacaulis biprosthecium]